MTILMTGGDKPLGLLDILEDDEQYGEFVESLPVRSGKTVKTRYVYTGPMPAREYPDGDADQLSGN